MVNIFEEASEKVMPAWAKFTNPGDSIQGTYVGCIKNVKDGYGNDQIVYQLMGDDGKITNVGFGLNKKFIVREMEIVKFGQIVGFKFKAWVRVKNKMGKETDVKDYTINHDPKIVNEVWLKENEGNMPTVTDSKSNEDTAEREFNNFGKKEDVPFSSEGSLTNEDKLILINKLAVEKLGVNDQTLVKDVVMEKTGIAFVPVNFQKIIDSLSAM
jgi:hypothetical protein